MGYTHYWYRKKTLSKDKFLKAGKDFQRVVDAIHDSEKIKLVAEYDKPDKPVIDNECIMFNGVGDNGYETFYIPRVFKPEDWQKEKAEGWFAFCKTARKPYDLGVTACLIIFKHYFGNEFKVHSDGEDKDWEYGKRMCQAVLGYGKDFKINRED